jgi:hypothetical protein
MSLLNALATRVLIGQVAFVVCCFALVADRRLRIPAIALVVLGPALPSAIGAPADPSSLAVGVAFGLAWVAIGALQATERWPDVAEVYPQHLRKPGATD